MTALRTVTLSICRHARAMISTTVEWNRRPTRAGEAPLAEVVTHRDDQRPGIDLQGFAGPLSY
jgi:hypothetical protein